MGQCQNIKNQCNQDGTEKKVLKTLHFKTQSYTNQQLSHQQNKRNIFQKAQEKKKVKIFEKQKYFDFDSKFFSFRQDILYIIIEYLIDQYHILLKVNSTWYTKINEIIQIKLTNIDNAFLKQYQNLFQFNNSYLNVKRIKFLNQKGFRMDQYILAEYTQNQNCNITLKVNFDIQYEGKRQKCAYEYEFNTVKGNRKIWIVQENANKQDESYSQPIMSIQDKDQIKLGFNFYNLNGLVDIDSIKWLPAQIQQVKEQKCEILQIYENWTDFKYSPHKDKIHQLNLMPNLYLQNIYCSGVGCLYQQTVFKAVKKGQCCQSESLIGIKIQVMEENEPITVNILRKGLIYDNENLLQLRVGDQIYFYKQVLD